MNDDPEIVPVDGSEAQTESTQTNETVTPEPTPSASLSLQDVERLVSERETKLRAEFDSRERKWQSKSDKAYAKALAEAKVIEDNAALLGLDAEQVTAAKQAVINKQFDTAFSTPEPETPAAPPPQADTVGADEIRAWLAAQGIVNETLVSNYAGKGRNTGVGWEAWDEDVTLAKAASIQQRKQAQQQKQQAAQAAQVKANVGRVNPVPAGGAPAQGYDPEKELEEMNKLSMPDDPAERVKFKAKRDRLMKEAGWE
jgi:hypothetical protein